MRMAMFLILGVLAPVIGEQPVKIDVTPGAALAPATLRVRATVESHDENRALTVSAESLTYRESTTRPLDGDAAPRVLVFRFTGLPAGDYVIEARLERRDGSVERDARDVRVHSESASSQQTK